jgi:hypothetical protein
MEIPADYSKTRNGHPQEAAEISGILDRMLIWNERHLRLVLAEFIGW